MSLFVRVSGIALILLVFLGIGFSLGTHRAGEPRFSRISDTRAFDTKTGQLCNTHTIRLPPGATADTPSCADLATHNP